MSGTVYLVGIGPGNRRDLTVRAVEVLSRVGAVLAPTGVPEEVLVHADAGIELVPEAAPEENARALVRLARRHGAVARLYFGDPVLLNPAALEADLLAAEGVTIEVVPGITPVVSAASSGGLPFTGELGRDPLVLQRSPIARAAAVAAVDVVHAGGCVATVGDAAGLARTRQTLLDAGLPGHLPAGIVWRAGSAGQSAWWGTLEGAPEGIWGEGVLLVGRCAEPRAGLSWFERRPLFGRIVVVTRPRAQATEFVAALEELGAQVMPVPMIRIVGSEGDEALRAAARNVGRYDWVVFTSANGVKHFWAALRSVGLDTRALGGVSICAIGPGTAAAVAGEGARADLLPEQYVAESVVDALNRAGVGEGSRVLLPRAEIARPVIPDSLRRLGAEVDEVVAYRTLADEPRVHGLREALSRREVDVITFTSSSTVRNYAELVSSEPPAALVATIGPITTATARDLGWSVAIEASEHTAAGLTDAIVAFFQDSVG